MKRRISLILLVTAAIPIAGCSPRSFYEGIQQQEAARTPPSPGQSAPHKPSYDAYEAERKSNSVQPGH